MHTQVPATGKQAGAFAVLFAVVLLVILGFCGLALDIGSVYNRKVDVHAIAKTVALAAARRVQMENVAEWMRQSPPPRKLQRASDTSMVRPSFGATRGPHV